jgi:membrane protein required for colicin V production
MNYVDILVAVSVVLFTLLGFKDGFFRKLFGILSFFVGFIVATKLMGPFGKLIMGWFEFAPIFSYSFAFFAILMVVVLIFSLIYKWLGTKATVLKTINRIAGAFIGAGQGLLVASLFLILIKFADMPSEETKRESLFYPTIISLGPKVFDYALSVVPDSKSFFEEIEKNLEKYQE